ncbi:MAG: hypothetical protein JW863_01805 [Chitinispirillaceae bacterium]|nr:hypothetical protein [Chitinispirillaceae bacterium]
MHSKDTVHQDRFKEENIKAEEAIANGNLSEAAAILVTIVEKNPENWRAFNNMGILSWSQNAWNDAYTMFRKSVSLRPDYTDALVNLFDAALKLRKIHEVSGIFEDSYTKNPEIEEIAILHECIRDQGDEIYHSRRAFAVGIYNPVLEEAKKELDSGNLYKAMDLFLQVNDKEGPNPEAFCGLGIISYYQERFDDAFVLFSESLKLNPTDKETFLNLLDAAKACNRLVDAQNFFTAFRNEFEELAVLNEHFFIPEKKD